MSPVRDEGLLAARVPTVPATRLTTDGSRQSPVDYYNTRYTSKFMANQQEHFERFATQVD
jgi:hypothetical protein